jgi:hypothetical protein
LARFLEIGEEVALKKGICHKCGEPAKNSCAKCKTNYCNKVANVSLRGKLIFKECQTEDWKSGGHKQECSAFKLIREWETWRWGKFEKYLDMP